MAVNKQKEDELLAKGTSSNYAQMSGMSDLHQTALTDAGNRWQEAYKVGDQAGMDAAHQQAEAIRALYNYSGGEDGSQYIPTQKPGFTYDVEKPTLNDSYSAQLDAMLNQLMNYGPFTYDAETDPTFQQYKDTYTREGQRAMQNTLGQVSARTGGLASSYATSAAQQANNYYMQQLSDKIPELRQLAYEMYMNDYNQQVQQYNLLSDAQQNEYNRYQDELNNWYKDYGNAYGEYWDNYNANQDLIDRTYDQNVAERDYKDKQEQTDYERGLTEKEAALNQVYEWIGEGAMPSEAVLEAAGISSEDVAAYLEARKSQQAAKGTDYKPNLSASAVVEALESGIVNDEMLKAYKYYYGQDWTQKPKEGDQTPWYDGMVDDGDYYTDPETGISHPKEVYGKDLGEYSDAAGNYQETAAMAADLYSKEGKTAVLNFLKEAHDTGALNTTDYSNLLIKYSGWDLSPR